MTERNQQHDVKDAVQATVKSGTDVHQQVKDIILKALTEHQLDKEISKVLLKRYVWVSMRASGFMASMARKIFVHAVRGVR